MGMNTALIMCILIVVVLLVTGQPDKENVAEFEAVEKM
jgi:hypothetical protein